MKNFAEKIKSLINPKKAIEDNPTPFDFVKTRRGILKELILSKQSKNLVGVYCKAFGEGMFLTAVEAIEDTEKQEVIVFHQYDISGRILSRARVTLDEIQMVCPFNKIYQNPLFLNKTRERINSTTV